MRRKLAEQQRLLAEQQARLEESLRQSDEPAPEPKPSEPPVWRMEEDHVSARPVGPTPARKRHLARQRQRDMIAFIIIFCVLLILFIIALWITYVRNTGPNTGA